MRHGPAIIYNAKVKGERKTEFVYDKEKNMMAAAPQIDIGPPAAEMEDQDVPDFATQDMPKTNSPWRQMRTKVAAGTSARKKTYIGRSNLPGDQYNMAATVGRKRAGTNASPPKWNN
jgi:hypothetical protein